MRASQSWMRLPTVLVSTSLVIVLVLLIVPAVVSAAAAAAAATAGAPDQNQGSATINGDMPPQPNYLKLVSVDLFFSEHVLYTVVHEVTEELHTRIWASCKPLTKRGCERDNVSVIPIG